YKLDLHIKNYFCSTRMEQLRKFRLNYFSAGVLTAAIALIFCSLTWKSASSRLPSKNIYSTLTSVPDTVPISKSDSFQNKKDTLIDTTVVRAIIDTTTP